MHRLALAVCAAAFAAASNAAAAAQSPRSSLAAPAFELTLRAAASTRGVDVTIADLCDVSPVGPEAAVIGQVRFGPAPVPGFTRTVSRTEVLQSLAAAGFNASAFALRGATESLVQTVVVEVPGQDVLDAATAVLRALLAAEGGDVEIEPPARLRLLQAPPGRQSQELRARVRGDQTGPTSAVVDVAIVVDGEDYKTLQLNFKLTRYHQVLKTIGTLRAGTPLGPENLQLVREPLALHTGLYLDSFAQVSGQIAKRNLQPSQRLSLGDVTPPAVVHRGEIVTVVMTSGRVKVTCKAMVNHDAAVGERVTVTNTESRAQITGIAAAPGTVVVTTAR